MAVIPRAFRCSSVELSAGMSVGLAGYQHSAQRCADVAKQLTLLIARHHPRHPPRPEMKCQLSALSCGYRGKCQKLEGENR